MGNQRWSVARLIELSKGKLTLREMVMHMKAVQDANLRYPIILDEDGEIMDGRHRIMKALLLGKKTIKAVRFDENPTPCKTIEE